MRLDDDKQQGRVTAYFTYESTVAPWASALKTQLNLKATGNSAVEFVREGPTLVPVSPPADIVNFRAVIYPPDGRNWYPHGMPGALVPHDLRV